MANGVYRLRISLDERHIHIAMWCIDAFQLVMPSNRVHCVEAPGCTVIGCSSRHWNELFPQHGPGKKHDPIALEPWQQEIVDRHPREFLRGLVHSDGSRFINRVRVKGKERRAGRVHRPKALSSCASSADGPTARPCGRASVAASSTTSRPASRQISSPAAMSQRLTPNS